MTMFDRRIPIHETEDGKPGIDTVIETLDEMLTQYGVNHFFAYATDHEQKATKETSGKDLCYWLYYDSVQNTETSLIIGLFMKTKLDKDDSKIVECVTTSIESEAEI